MKKQIICIIILFFLCGSVVLSYEMYTPGRYEYYSTGKYENLEKRNPKFYKDYFESNKNECVQYYCYIPDDSDYGYLLERSGGIVGYSTQEFMGRIEKIRCHRTEDKMPVVKSFEEAKNYRD